MFNSNKKGWQVAISGLLLLVIIGGLFLFTTDANAYVRVRGYYRKDGTYVRPHVRSNPNALRYDNYGYRGGRLYNPSYFSSRRNYSSSWYTPSYITDPYYYWGKSLYRTKSYYPSYNRYSSSYPYYYWGKSLYRTKSYYPSYKLYYPSSLRSSLWNF